MKPLPPPPPLHKLSDIPENSIRRGIGLGGAIAVAISWSLNKSILWALLHGFCSWFYVLYYAIFL